MLSAALSPLFNAVNFCMSQNWDPRMAAVPFRAIDILCIGSFMFLISQFIRYLLGHTSRANFCVKNIVKFIALYILYILLAGLISTIATGKYVDGSAFFFIVTISIIKLAAKVMILISLGLILRMTFPIIEESKATV